MSKSVIFVCWGNICRSPMAADVAAQEAAEQGLDLDISSAGVSREEIGNGIDPRAARTLREHGYEVRPHTAHQITAEEIADADLVIGMEQLHLDRMRQICGGELDTDKVKLLTDFDPEAIPGSGVDDPWYGGQDGFTDTLSAIESAMPGVLDRLR
ncbi:low molecular weight protein-tyrosine-phosphatase [Naumannella halotolerans]|uniref:protein-tyrosine-phosphatase n=1 Tax=Naumannella halotolerans TaxID=993414 RepID=A0A4R7J279_9ACTN|nr:low molecular weight protein-tyrosine-phosphatase [Naumannella halotolerans]TDT31250.1 protein-tyrosine phosphatase [Naumannella halotolerans]